MNRDPNLDTLLLLDGEMFILEGSFWVKFEVKRVSVRPEKPHGLNYSLTLHDGDGERLWVLTTLIPFVKARDPERGFASSMTTSIEVSASAFMTM